MIKKLVVLMALLVTAGMLWAQAAAAPAGPSVTLNAVISYMNIWDMAGGKEYSDKPQYEIKWTWLTPDGLTKAYLEFEEGPMAPGFATGGTNGPAPAALGFNGNVAGTSADWGWADGVSTFGALPDKAWVVTDVAKAFALPIPLTFKFGLEEWQGPDTIYITSFPTHWEEYMAESPADFRTWGGQVEIGLLPGMVTLRTSWAWNPDPKELVATVYGTVAPITYEATYSTNSQDFDKGWLEGGAKFVMDVVPGINLGLSAAGEYDLQDLGTIAAPTWRLQAGAQAMFNKMASLGLFWRGQDQAETGGLQVQGWAMPVAGKPLDLFATLGLGINSDLYAETFESLELAVRYTIGKTAFYVGYYFQADPTGAASSSIAKEWLDMDVAGANKSTRNDTSGLWFRATMSL